MMAFNHDNSILKVFTLCKYFVIDNDKTIIMKLSLNISLDSSHFNVNITLKYTCQNRIINSKKHFIVIL